MDNRKVIRGDMYYADLNPVIGSEQGGIRPILIISNNIGNEHSPTVVAAITTRKKPDLPTHVTIGRDCNIEEDSTIMLEQIRTLDKSRLSAYIGKLDGESMREVNEAISISFGLIDKYNN